MASSSAPSMKMMLENGDSAPFRHWAVRVTWRHNDLVWQLYKSQKGIVATNVHSYAEVQ